MAIRLSNQETTDYILQLNKMRYKTQAFLLNPDIYVFISLYYFDPGSALFTTMTSIVAFEGHRHISIVKLFLIYVRDIQHTNR